MRKPTSIQVADAYKRLSLERAAFLNNVRMAGLEARLAGSVLKPDTLERCVDRMAINIAEIDDMATAMPARRLTIGDLVATQRAHLLSTRLASALHNMKKSGSSIVAVPLEDITRYHLHQISGNGNAGDVSHLELLAVRQAEMDTHGFAGLRGLSAPPPWSEVKDRALERLATTLDPDLWRQIEPLLKQVETRQAELHRNEALRARMTTRARRSAHCPNNC